MLPGLRRMLDGCACFFHVLKLVITCGFLTCAPLVSGNALDLQYYLGERTAPFITRATANQPTLYVEEPEAFADVLLSWVFTPATSLF
jgi:hypothetical protein